MPPSGKGVAGAEAIMANDARVLNAKVTQGLKAMNLAPGTHILSVLQKGDTTYALTTNVPSGQIPVGYIGPSPIDNTTGRNRKTKKQGPINETSKSVKPQTPKISPRAEMQINGQHGIKLSANNTALNFFSNIHTTNTPPHIPSNTSRPATSPPAPTNTSTVKPLVSKLADIAFESPDLAGKIPNKKLVVKTNTVQSNITSLAIKLAKVLR